MTENKEQGQDMNKLLFMNLVMMLASSAMQQLGKLVNPMTNKIEVNLEGAQVTIDLITMLQAKTRGNLDKDEEKMLNDLLSSLQLNYVETSQSSAGQAASAPQEEVAAKAEKPSAEAAEKPAEDDAGGEKKDPKFRKSYGG